LGRVDLRVDHGHFRNHMKIQESRRADNSVGRSRIGSGRHGGRPSQEQEATSSPQTYHQCLPRSLKMNHHLKFRCALMGVFTLRPCASAGKQQVVLDFFEIGWSVIVRSDRSASSQSKQNYLAQRRRAFCNGSVLVDRHLRGKTVGEGRPPCRPQALWKPHENPGVSKS